LQLFKRGLKERKLVIKNNLTQLNMSSKATKNNASNSNKKTVAAAAPAPVETPAKKERAPRKERASSGSKLALLPVHSSQSGSYNVKELSKQLSSLLTAATKAVLELKEVNEENVHAALLASVEATYSYAVTAALEGKKGKRARRVRDPNAPKKPLSNYMVYCMKNRKDVQAKNPNAKPTEISRILGAQWNKLSAEQKAKFVESK